MHLFGRCHEKIIIAFLVSVAVSGCTNNQGLNPVLSTDRYSGSKTVLIQPHASDCETAQCISIGAFWSSDQKDMALVTLSLMNTTNFISDAYFEIDGVRYPLRDNGDLTRYESPFNNLPGIVNSKKDYVVPLDLIRKISSSRKTWVFVKAGGGYYSNAVIDSKGDSKAYYAMQRFINALPK